MTVPMNKTSNLKRAGASVVLGSGSEDLLRRGTMAESFDYLGKFYPYLVIVSYVSVSTFTTTANLPSNEKTPCEL